MAEILSKVTELPESCKSAADHMAAELAKEDAYVDLSGDCVSWITDLERAIAKETGEKVALVAYRIS